VKFTCAGRTDVGIIRTGNEDNYLMVPDRGVFIVADGMGGHAAGEVASEMAVRIVARELGDLTGVDDAEMGDRVRRAIHEANSAIFQRTLTEPDKRGMGTTATIMLINGPRYLIGQVGDSRGYQMRSGQLLQITKDHSYVQEQVDAGFLSPEEARTHPYSNVITRCVGANVDVVPDVYVGSLRPGDVYLLASDGLTGMLEDPELRGILSAGQDPPETVESLIVEANKRGGLDNITAILIRVDHVDAGHDQRTTHEVARV
jgi:protein phosphatase